MTSDPSNYHREYSPYGSYSLFEFEGSDVISVLKNTIEYSFVFFKCLIKLVLITQKWAKCGFVKTISLTLILITYITIVN